MQKQLPFPTATPFHVAAELQIGSLHEPYKAMTVEEIEAQRMFIMRREQEIEEF